MSKDLENIENEEIENSQKNEEIVEPKNLEGEEEEEEGDDDDSVNGLYEWYQFRADPGQKPLRVDKFLMARLEKMTRSKIQSGIEAGFVLVNGRTVKSNHKIMPNHVVTVRWNKARREDYIVPEDIPLDIRYEDDQVILLHKPAGMVVHPGIGNYRGTLVNALAWKFSKLPILETCNEYPGIVHRIDKNTTGLMVVAKTELAIQKLAKQFFDHTIQRKYMALVWGDVEADEGTIEGHIGRDEKDRKKFTVYEDGSQGKSATTHYKVIRRYGYVTLIECQLETGRTHQIRVHMKHLGHPLFNDDTYGGDKIVKGTVFTKYKEFVLNCFKLLPHQALHAFSLGFTHPSTGENLYLEAPLPDYFLATLEKWEGYTEGRLTKGERIDNGDDGER